jgi:hypothetical protein
MFVIIKESLTIENFEIQNRMKKSAMISPTIEYFIYYWVFLLTVMSFSF